MGARGEGEEKARFSDGSIDFDLSVFFLGTKRNEQWARRKPWPSLKASRVRVYMHNARPTKIQGRISFLLFITSNGAEKLHTDIPKTSLRVKNFIRTFDSKRLRTSLDL